MMLDKETCLLESIRALTEGSMDKVSGLLADPALIDLAWTYAENKGKRVIDVGLNLFVLISDIYHRENFHSDVLKIVLDPSSPHNEGDKYLRLFLEFLNASRKDLRIDPANYADATVFREQGRVDLIIQGGGSEKHAIIIENKMNGAPDMRRQIPRYLDYVKEQGCTCDAIVYLRLSTTRHPDTTDWTAHEQTEIYPKLVAITAYNDTDSDLLSGWLNKCEKASAHVDVQLILRQYGTLIQKLGGDIMNKPIMQQFYAMMLNAENFKAAQSLASMWKDLVLYRVETIIDIFKADVAPFKKIDNWKDGDAYFTGLIWREAHFGLDIVVVADGYNLQLWDRKDDECKRGLLKMAIHELKCDQKYPVVEGVVTKTFAFPSEHDQMMTYVIGLKEDLKGLKASKK